MVDSTFIICQSLDCWCTCSLWRHHSHQYSSPAAVPHNIKDLRWTLLLLPNSRVHSHTQGPPLLHCRDLSSCLPAPTLVNTYTLSATLTCHWDALWAQLQSTPPSTPSVHPSSSRSLEVALTLTTL